jgi:hypothetical protein
VAWALACARHHGPVAHDFLKGSARHQNRIARLFVKSAPMNVADAAAQGDRLNPRGTGVLMHVLAALLSQIRAR